MNTTPCTDWPDADPIPLFDDSTTDAPLHEVYYDSNHKDYWVQNDRNQWMAVNETSLRRLLKGGGLGSKVLPGECVSPLDARLNEIQRRYDVAFAGPLAGYRAGVNDMCGNRILVTTAPSIIIPKQGEWPTINALLDNLFIDASCDQRPYVYGWLKVAYEALRAGKIRPGQALVIAGEKNCGKSLMQKLITEILGGRVAKPYREMSGGTSFNSELFGAEHLMIEDEVANTDTKKRLAFGARIKDITVNAVQSHHAKNRQAISLMPFWRFSITLNIEPENLLILPPIEESLADKIILLKAHRKPMPMPTFTDAEREAFWQTLVSELPAFLSFLEKWSLPEILKCPRFGIIHYHHPEILSAISALSPEVRLLELIDIQFWPVDAEGAPLSDSVAQHKTTARALESCLVNSELTGHEAKKLLYWPNATGTYLGRLARSHPGRVKQARTQNAREWLIFEPPGPEEAMTP